MDSHDSVAAMAGAYAEQAVKAALAWNAQLDYSENSLLHLEELLGRLSPAPEAEEMSEICKIWGSYLGEVVRRRFGGEWSIETYPGKDFATMTLNVGGSKIFPTMKIHRRLTRGLDDSVWSFYKMVKARLETAPDGRIQ